MGTEITPNLAGSMVPVLSEEFGLNQEIASKILKDNRIDGIELWSNFLDLKAINRLCNENPRCIASVDKSFFTQNIEKALLTSASLNPSGSKDKIDSLDEVKAFQELVKIQMAQIQFEANRYGFNSQITSARDRLVKRWKLKDEDVEKVLSSTPNGVTYHSMGIKNTDKPDTVVILCSLPSTGNNGVLVDHVYQFLLGTMDRYDDYTTLYEVLYLTEGNLPGKGQFSGTYLTHDVLRLTLGTFSTFDIRINWFRLGSEAGRNEGAFVIRFSLVPGSQQGNLLKMDIECAMMEGLVLIRPTLEPDGEKRVLIELELDFDLALAPDWLINYLMTGEVERFVKELVTELYAFVPSR